MVTHFVINFVSVILASFHCHCLVHFISVGMLYNHLPPWIRSFDLFRHRRIAIVSWGATISSSSRFVVEGMFQESGVVHSFKVVDPVLFVFESQVLYSRDL